MLKNLKLAQKLMAGFLAVALIAAFVGVFGSMHLRAGKARASDMYQKITIPLEDLADLAWVAEEVEIDLRTSLLDGTPAGVDRAQAHMTELRAIANKAAEDFNGRMEQPEIKQAFDDYKVVRGKYREFSDQAYSDLRAGKKAEVVAAHLSCSEATVLRLARAGRIPSRKISNGCRCHWRFDLEDVLNATRNGTTA